MPIKAVAASNGVRTYAFASKDAWMHKIDRYFSIADAIADPAGSVLYVWDGNDLIYTCDMFYDIQGMNYTYELIEEIERRLATIKDS